MRPFCSLCWSWPLLSKPVRPARSRASSRTPKAVFSPRATVRVSGPLLPAGLDRVTSATGAFQVQRLLPGSYTVEADLAGMGTAVREVQVNVDVDAQLNFVLSPAGIEDTVEVVAGDPGGRPQEHRGQLRLHRGRHREAAADPQLRGPVRAHARRSRQQRLRAQRGRQPPGQHLPDRRRQHHQPRLRLPRHQTQTEARTSASSTSSAAPSPPSSAAPRVP